MMMHPKRFLVNRNRSVFKHIICVGIGCWLTETKTFGISEFDLENLCLMSEGKSGTDLASWVLTFRDLAGE